MWWLLPVGVVVLAMLVGGTLLLMWFLHRGEESDPVAPMPTPTGRSSSGPTVLALPDSTDEPPAPTLDERRPPPAPARIAPPSATPPASTPPPSTVVIPPIATSAFPPIPTGWIPPVGTTTTTPPAGSSNKTDKAPKGDKKQDG